MISEVVARVEKGVDALGHLQPAAEPRDRVVEERLALHRVFRVHRDHAAAVPQPRAEVQQRLDDGIVGTRDLDDAIVVESGLERLQGLVRGVLGLERRRRRILDGAEFVALRHDLRELHRDLDEFEVHGERTRLTGSHRCSRRACEV